MSRGVVGSAAARRYGLALAGWLLLVAAALVARKIVFDASRPSDLVWQSAGLVAIGVAVTGHRVFARTLRRCGGAQRAALLALPATIVAGQLLQQPSATWPFVNWDMYTQPAQGDPRFFVYRATRASGRESELDVVDAYPFLGRSLLFQLDGLADAALRVPFPPARRVLLAKLESWIRSIARRQEEREPGDPIQRVELVQVTVPLAAPGPPVPVATGISIPLEAAAEP